MAVCAAPSATRSAASLPTSDAATADCRSGRAALHDLRTWPLEAFEVTGEYATYDNDSFCPRCGSRLFLIDEEWGGVELQLGSLDDAPFELRPEAEIWIKRREPWMHEVEGAAQHRESRN